MRLFIALPVTAGVQQALTETQAALQKKGVRGRFVPPENFHLTLCFLGSAPDPQPVIDAMGRVPLPKTALTFDKLTLFGDVTVARLKKDAALENYVRALRQALDDAAISYDKQAFRPHVTLARKTALPYPGLRLTCYAKPLFAQRLPVKEVCLFASDLGGGTPRYSAVYTKKANGGSPR